MVGLTFGPLLKFFQAKADQVISLRFNFCKELRACLIPGKLGYLLKFFDKFLFLGGKSVELFLDLLVAAFQIFLPAADILDLSVEIFFFLLQPAFRPLQFATSFLCVAVKLLPQYQDLFLAFSQDLAFGGFRFFCGIPYDSFSF